MTDAETICDFMEPRPDKGPFDFHPWLGSTPDGWWLSTSGWDLDATWKPRSLSLDALHLVEARLKDEQFWQYVLRLIPRRTMASSEAGMRALIHATADQKIKALAAVIRDIKNA